MMTEITTNSIIAIDNIKIYETSIKTTTKEELLLEKNELLLLYNMIEPSAEELIEIGKQSHPYYQDRPYALERIVEIDKILVEMESK